MKTRFVIFVSLIGFLLFSCNSIDSQIRAYEKACNAGDYEKALKIAVKLSKQSDKITAEQSLRILAAGAKCADSMKDLYKDDNASISNTGKEVNEFEYEDSDFDDVDDIDFDDVDEEELDEISIPKENKIIQKEKPKISNIRKEKKEKYP